MPKVSVIVPVYGVEKYIERCARSLFKQTLDDIEFIFVDDCTPDRSIEILKQLLEDYPQRKKQVIIVSHEKNMGLPIARQSGLKVASGKYIAHCDSDDWVDVTMYEKMYNKAIKEDADIVVCGYRETDRVNVLREGSHSFATKEEYIARMLYMKEAWTVWDKLCHRSLYEGIEYPQYNMGEDMLFTFQLVLKANNVSIVNEILYNYFFNPASITKVQSDEKRFNNWEQSIYNAERVLSYFTRFKLDKTYYSALEYYKYKQKKVAGNLAYNKAYANRWLQKFSSTHKSFWSLEELTLTEKIKYCIVVICSWINTL